MASILDDGLFGIGIQSLQVGAPLQGFFGLNIQTKSNALITIMDENGRNVFGVDVGVSYTVNGVLSSTTFVYLPTQSGERSFPENVLITINVGGEGFVTKTFTYTIPTDGFAAMTMVLHRLPLPLFIQRRPFFGVLAVFPEGA